MGILDQRGFHNVDTVKQVHDQWADWAEQVNSDRARRGLSLLAPVDHTRDISPVYCYVNESRWVADCANPRSPDTGRPCRGGMFAWPDHPRVFCPDCLSLFRTVFPSKSRIDECLPILNARPDPRTRNWIHYTHPGCNDPKRLTTTRWHETEDRDEMLAGDGYESARWLRFENKIMGGLSGDDTGQRVVASPRATSTLMIELPEVSPLFRQGPRTL